METFMASIETDNLLDQF